MPSETTLYCGRCGKAGVGAFKTCSKCGWCAPTAEQMLDVPICAGCGYIFFAPQEVCSRCGAPGPKPLDMEKAMRASLDMTAAMLLDPSLRPPQKPDPDWKETAAMLASALKLKRDDPTNPFCDAVVDCALLAYKTLLEADDE